jgi:hypothetical protein
MDLQKLKIYKVLGSRNLPFMIWWVEWFSWGSSYGYSHLVQAVATANIIFCWGPGYNKCFSLRALATISVISSLGYSCSRCHILLGPYPQPMLYSVQALATDNVVFCWGPTLQPMSFLWGLRYCQCHILVGSWLRPMLYSVGNLTTISVNHSHSYPL